MKRRSTTKKLMGIFLSLMLMISITAGGAAQGEGAAEVRFAGQLTGTLINREETGKLVYWVTMIPGAGEANEARIWAYDYVCALLLMDSNIQICMLTETGFELKVDADFIWPEELDPVDAGKLGLRVAEDENGVYLDGDVAFAAGLLAGAWRAETILADLGIPLSGPEDEGTAEEAAEAAKPAEPEKDEPKDTPAPKPEEPEVTEAPKSLEPEKEEPEETAVPKGEETGKEEPEVQPAETVEEPGEEPEKRDEGGEGDEAGERTEVSNEQEAETGSGEPETGSAGEAAQETYTAVIKLSDPSRMIYTGDLFGIEVSGLTGAVSVRLPKGILFDEDLNINNPAARSKANLAYNESNGTVTVTPSSPEGKYFILLSSEDASRYELQLTDASGGGKVGEKLTVNIRGRDAEEEAEATGEAASEGDASHPTAGEPEDEDGQAAFEEAREDGVPDADGAQDGEEEPAEEASEAEETETIAPVITLSASCEGGVLKTGALVTLTADISGIPEGVAYSLQWENNQQGEFMDVPGETDISVTFVADEQTIYCRWRVRIVPFN